MTGCTLKLLFVIPQELQQLHLYKWDLFNNMLIQLLNSLLLMQFFKYHRYYSPPINYTLDGVLNIHQDLLTIIHFQLWYIEEMLMENSLLIMHLNGNLWWQLIFLKILDFKLRYPHQWNSRVIWWVSVIIYPHIPRLLVHVFFLHQV